jgi:type IV secretion system protein VirB9
MSPRLTLLCAALWLLAAQPSPAAVEPRAEGGDRRLRVVDYDPTEVVALRGVLGYQMMIVFDPAEKIENVAIGDSLNWQVVPSHTANLLFLKPMGHAPATNMAVVTNLRRYAFALSVERGRARDLIYSVRFSYSAPITPVIGRPAPPPPAPPQDVNHAYSYEGSSRNVPTRLFDDGHATYFLFREGEEFPAIFTLEPDKGEAVVNSSMRDGYVVVERLAPAFVLRRGKDVTRIYNDGFREPQPGPLSPQPRRKASWFTP